MANLYGIVLAAGGSTRMGRPKALLTLNDEPLLCAHVRALSARCSVVRVIVGAYRDQVLAALPPEAESLENPDWATTHTRDSLRIGLKDIPDNQHVVITPVDTPPVSELVLDALLRVQGPAVPYFHGTPGHPVVVQAGAARIALQHGTLRDHTIAATRVSVEDPNVCVGFNTPDEWNTWTRTYSSPRTSRS